MKRNYNYGNLNVKYTISKSITSINNYKVVIIKLMVAQSTRENAPNFCIFFVGSLKKMGDEGFQEIFFLKITTRGICGAVYSKKKV